MKKYILAYALLLSFTIIKAQTDSIKSYELKPVTVTTSKIETAFKNLYPASKNVVLQEMGTSSSNSLMSTLSAKIPGIFVTEKGFSGFGISNPAGRISIRGLNGIQHVLVIIDGRPEYAGLFGHPISDLYSNSSISSVEIIPGSASVIYGGNAMGGVINIKTNYPAQEGTSINIGTNYGSFNSYNIHGAVTYKKEKFSARLFVNNDYSDNERPSASYNSRSAGINAYYSFSNNWDLSFNSSLSRMKSFDPGTVANPSLNNSVWYDVNRAGISLNLKNKFEAIEGNTILFFNNGVHDVFDGFHSEDKMFGISVNQGMALTASTIFSFGGDIKNYGGSARNRNPIVDTTINEAGAYLMISQKLVDRLTINGATRLANHSVFGTKLLPQINLTYAFNNLTIYAGAAEGFRSPTIAELFMFAANVNLKPEHSWNYELGLKGNPILKNLMLNTTAYIIEGKDLIAGVGAPPNRRNENIGSVKNIGFEFSANYQPVNNLLFNFAFSHVDMKTKMIGVPESQLFVGSIFNYKKLQASINIKSIGNLYKRVAANNLTELKENYALLNAGLAYHVYDNLKIYVNGDNLLNKNYEIILGYPMPGRAISIGANFRSSLE